MFGYILAYVVQQQYFEFWILLAASIVSGLTISSRLYLNKHTFEEVTHGWLIAVCITFAVNFFHV
jgi:membrane-associated phospholipid phosphatase